MTFGQISRKHCVHFSRRATFAQIERDGMIMVAKFDILKRTPDGAYIWLEAVHDLSGAKGRLQELCVGSSDDYFVFDQKTQRVHTRRDLDHL
jgi:hypothetical protein